MNDNSRQTISLSLLFVCLISSVITSIFLYTFWHHNENAKLIQDIQENLGALTRHIFESYEPTHNLEQSTHLSRSNFREKVMFEIQQAHGTIELLQKRVNFLEKINYDKFGRTDYASALWGGKVIRVYSQQRSWYSSYFERLLKIGRYRSANRNCCINENDCPGESRVLYGSVGSVVMKLFGPVFIEGVTVEHVSQNVLPNSSVESAMKKFQVFGMSDSALKGSGHFLYGSFIFDPAADFIQYFNFSSQSPVSYQYIKINVESNHGAEYTCIYRLRVHGTLDSNIEFNQA
ncbi:SUN domain-containing protein 2 [Wyeomyia smithii]|uniref:SUN domain-containing protein 2 n=1 Tax=Wyeomyia smithii TaxID=174621 RepID=UPI002468133B|nr:SUN domain-containing protein 2 [Wyeomyia smithii]